MMARAFSVAALTCCGLAGAASSPAMAQPALVAPPVPPAPPTPGSEWFDRARAEYVDGLRRSCLSEGGIAIAVEHWTEWHAGAAERLRHERTVRQELGEAALTVPVDLDRLERALAADTAAQAGFRTALNANSMRIMHRLSRADRIIFARRLTVMSPASPAKKCAAR